jgi:hypothetical protein
MMTEEEGVLWDNDPFAIPMTPERKFRLACMVYQQLQDAGTAADSDVAVAQSKRFDFTYKDWLNSNGKA